MSKAVASAALDRAHYCATQAQTDCVLGAEVGFDIPVAFVYDSHEGFRMIVAPRILTDDRDASLDPERSSVRLQDPVTERGMKTFTFDKQVTVEYLKGGSRTIEVSTFRGVHTRILCPPAPILYTYT